MTIDPTPPRRRRGWLPWIAALGVVVLFAVVGVVGVEWFDGGSDSHGQPDGADLVRSNPRALTAEVLTHVPSDVTVLWSTGHGGLGHLMPGPPAGLRGGLLTSLLLKANGHQYYLVVVSSLRTADDPGTPERVIPKNDSQGRLVSEMVLSSSDSATTVAAEIAGPGGAGHLPLSEDALKHLVNDPLIGPRTTPRMLQKAKNVAGFTMSPPPIRWPHTPL